MTPFSPKPETEARIDACLRALGSAPPPAGLAARLRSNLAARMDAPRRSAFLFHSPWRLVSAGLAAASVALAAFLLIPGPRMAGSVASSAPAGMHFDPLPGFHQARGFGSASAMRIPSRAVPVSAASGRGQAASSSAWQSDSVRDAAPAVRTADRPAVEDGPAGPMPPLDRESPNR